MADDLAAVLRVGQQAFIHFGARESDSPRYSTILRGWVNRSYLMADTPLVDGKAMPIVLGAPCVIRFLANGTACGFSSTIVYAKRNETIFRAAWPSDVEYVIVRKHERVSTSLRCLVSGTPQGTQTAELIDLSAGGCRIALPVAVDPGSVIGLTIELPEGRPLGPIKATIRSALARGAGFSLGCQFDKLEEALRLEIENLVAQRMQSLRAGSGTNPRVILVGHNLAFIDGVRRMLGAQWEVVTATGAIDAFHCLRTSHVNALIAEWDLPDLPGVEICRVVRATKEFERLPVLVYGGSASDVPIAGATGVSRFFPAGAAPEEVALAIRELGLRHDTAPTTTS